jgi:hypothetical protein
VRQAQTLCAVAIAHVYPELQTCGLTVQKSTKQRRKKGNSNKPAEPHKYPQVFDENEKEVVAAAALLLREKVAAELVATARCKRASSSAGLRPAIPGTALRWRLSSSKLPTSIT